MQVELAETKRRLAELEDKYAIWEWNANADGEDEPYELPVPVYRPRDSSEGLITPNLENRNITGLVFQNMS